MDQNSLSSSRVSDQCWLRWESLRVSRRLSEQGDINGRCLEDYTCECDSGFELKLKVVDVSVTVNQHTEGRQAGEQAAPAHFQLKVKDQQGSEVQFKVKKSTQLRKLMDAELCMRGCPKASQSQPG